MTMEKTDKTEYCIGRGHSTESRVTHIYMNGEWVEPTFAFDPHDDPHR